MAIPHPASAGCSQLYHFPWLGLKYFIALMLFRLKPAGLVFQFPPWDGSRTCLPEEKLIERSLTGLCTCRLEGIVPSDTEEHMWPRLDLCTQGWRTSARGIAGTCPAQGTSGDGTGITFICSLCNELRALIPHNSGDRTRAKILNNLGWQLWCELFQKGCCSGALSRAFWNSGYHLFDSMSRRHISFPCHSLSFCVPVLWARICVYILAPRWGPIELPWASLGVPRICFCWGLYLQEFLAQACRRRLPAHTQQRFLGSNWWDPH